MGSMVSRPRAVVAICLPLMGQLRDRRLGRDMGTFAVRAGNTLLDNGVVKALASQDTHSGPSTEAIPPWSEVRSSTTGGATT
jgi:hypothetical protein